MSEGYSVVIFPEGTRSADCKIKRFHKGAFYLANKLNLEIQPILLHGLGQIMNKREFFLRRGRVVIKMLDKINLQKGTFGSDYSTQTKGVLKYMREEYNKIRLKMEVPDRLKYFLINRYIFRGPIIEWYLRIKLKLEKNYNLFNEIVPREGVITDIGCGYGFMTTMLAMTSDERIITGIDYDEDKIITAQNCTFDLKNLSFKHGNISKLDLPQSDVFLLIDVLHYMSAEKQANLINHCFSRLNTNGRIIIRDADTDLKRRTFGTRVSEILSTNIGFNKVEEKLTFVSKQQILDIVDRNGGKVEIIDQTKLNSNLIYNITG
jgi:2-polyprenyl-3-methyl-5-hydroxy-6-metoxy-1,4-benzoquinol methylase